jgi:acetyltransferase-like isoleucine patch superfamily enzyme
MYIEFAYSFFRVLFLRFLKKGFNAPLIQYISPLAEISLISSSKIKLGTHCDFRKNVTIIATGNGVIEIGDRVFMNQNCTVSSKAKITIGDRCNLGPNVCIFDNDHRYERGTGVSTSDYLTENVEIGSGTWLASNVVVLKGTKIGKNCVIGAGAVVKGDIPDGSLVYSNRTLIVKSIE